MTGKGSSCIPCFLCLAGVKSLISKMTPRTLSKAWVRQKWRKSAATGRGTSRWHGSAAKTCWLAAGADQQDLLDLLAFCVSVSINTVISHENAASVEVSHLMHAMNLDMA